MSTTIALTRNDEYEITAEGLQNQILNNDLLAHDTTFKKIWKILNFAEEDNCYHFAQYMLEDYDKLTILVSVDGWVGIMQRDIETTAENGATAYCLGDCILSYNNREFVMQLLFSSRDKFYEIDPMYYLSE